MSDSSRTFRSLTDVVLGVTKVTLAEDAGPFKEGDEVIILQVINDQGRVRCRKFDGFAHLISQDTKIQ